MINDQILDSLMKSPDIKNTGLKKEFLSQILDIYHNILLNNLLDNGYVYIGDNVRAEIVQLTNRVHVLRGIPYKGHRNYKLKVTMQDPVYNKIEEYYNRLKEEIL